MKKTITTISIVLLTTISANEFSLGKLNTGQTVSYTDYDDGYYQIGKKREYTRDDEKNIVTDLATGLMWQDDSDVGSIEKNWEDAKTYCSGLTLGGYSDWYLPSIEELVSITDKGRDNPAINPIFQNVDTGSYYWSSTTNANYTDVAWSVVFKFGGINYYCGKKNSRYVRCLRFDGQ